jgi:hypothetical protein
VEAVVAAAEVAVAVEAVRRRLVRLLVVRPQAVELREVP